MTNLQSISQQDLARSSILWFSLAFILTIIPQLYLFLPIWVAGLFVVCFLWRIQISRMRIGYPNGIVKFAMIAAIIGTLFLTKGNFLNTEGCTILFMAIYALKFVESRTIRDGYILACIGLIALASIYLFDNSAYLFAFTLLIFLTLIMALIGLQQLGYGIYSRKKLLWNALKIIGISLPLMAVLFVIFPRFPSMLPNMQKGEEQVQAQTGVSNRMEPGSIAELANSETHVLWAEFSRNVPEIKDLYWRSLTLDHFDGRAWLQSSLTHAFSTPNYKIRNIVGEQKYTVIFDPSFQRFLATLDVSQIQQESMGRNNNIYAYNDFRFEYERPIDTKIQYTATVWPNTTLLNRITSNKGIEEKQFLQSTQNNPRSTALAKEILQKHPTKEAFVAELLRHFKEEGYQYTMQPGLLQSRDSIDEFMFDAKVGFCEHYASATAFMLRKAGIPSRIVIGYLGGAVDKNRKLVEVRGKDAHAWVEYWDEEKGWLRVDPTNAVAPNRVDIGVDDLINSLTGVSKVSTWKQISDGLMSLKDMIDYRWTKMVLGYQNESQQSFLSKLFQIDFISVFTLVKISIGLLCSFVIVQVILFLKPWQRLYFNLNREYGKVIELANRTYRLDFPVSIAPVELSEQLIKYLPLEEGKQVQKMADAMVAYFYQPNPAPQDLSNVKKTLYAVQKILKEKNVKR